MPGVVAAVHDEKGPSGLREFPEAAFLYSGGVLEALIAVLLWLFLKGYPLLWLLAAIIFIPGVWFMRTGAPFVPTPRKTMKTMFDFADLKPGEKMYDLGCGDGRFLIEAAKRGAIAVGYEVSIPTYLLAKLRTLFKKNIAVRYGNFWTKDYCDADVIFCYLLISSMQDFREKIWPSLRPGCRVVSHAFRMKGIEAAKDQDGVALYVKS